MEAVIAAAAEDISADVGDFWTRLVGVCADLGGSPATVLEVARSIGGNFTAYDWVGSVVCDGAAAGDNRAPSRELLAAALAGEDTQPVVDAWVRENAGACVARFARARMSAPPAAAVAERRLADAEAAERRLLATDLALAVVAGIERLPSWCRVPSPAELARDAAAERERVASLRAEADALRAVAARVTAEEDRGVPFRRRLFTEAYRLAASIHFSRRCAAVLRNLERCEGNFPALRDLVGWCDRVAQAAAAGTETSDALDELDLEFGKSGGCWLEALKVAWRFVDAQDIEDRVAAALRSLYS